MQKKVWISFIVLFVLISNTFAQSGKVAWVDSVFRTLNQNEKIGQMFFVPVNGYSDDELEKLESQIKKNKIGGVVMAAGDFAIQARAINHLQKNSAIPLFIGINTEETLGTKLNNSLGVPPPIVLGAIKDDSLLFFLGAEIGKQLKAIGFNTFFGLPSNLINSTNSKNQIYKSFGEDKNAVADKVAAYQSGLRSENIFTITNNYASLEQVDQNKLFPLQRLNRNRMVGVLMPYKSEQIASDQKKFLSKPTQPAPDSYSPAYLRQQAGFDGLIAGIFTDSTIFSKKIKPGDAELYAVKNGSDLLILPQNFPAALRRMRRSLRKDKLLQARLDESVKKILSTKFDAGLTETKNLNTDNLKNQINSPSHQALQAALYERSVTLVKDEGRVLPLRGLDVYSYASISMGAAKENIFTKYLSKYEGFTHFKIQQTKDTVALVNNLKPNTLVIAAIFPGADSLEASYFSVLRKIRENKNIVIVNFDSPDKLTLVRNFNTVIQATDDHELLQRALPQLLFGAKGFAGVSPISINGITKAQQSLTTSPIKRITYGIPEEVGLDEKTLHTIDTVAKEAIAKRAAPGCQVLVARHGKIVYEKSFGALTYDKTSPVTDQTIYDLASVTKVMATLQAVMFLEERGMIDIYKKASVYLPELLNTNKKDIILKDILTHQSGLYPFLLMWPNTVKGDTLLAHYYSPMKSYEYPLQVAPNLFASKVMQDSVWQWVLKSEMLTKPPRTPFTPRYSDLGFMILHRIVERLVNQPMEDFLSQNVYEPLGASTMGYLPLTKYPPTQIAPTERDTIFRKSIVLGTVHDERAAMLGGVAGHAGLFGSGNDLIKLGQMLLQKGMYGGQTFYRPQTVELFAQKQFENSSRGLGWAKPGDPNSPSSRYLSPKGFGHTGFTGTCIWMDPEFDLVFVFLSNSRFPDRSSKLNSTNIRSRMQDAVYQSIFNYCQYGESHPDEKLMRYLRKPSN